MLTFGVVTEMPPKRSSEIKDGDPRHPMKEFQSRIYALTRLFIFFGSYREAKQTIWDFSE